MVPDCSDDCSQALAEQERARHAAFMRGTSAASQAAAGVSDWLAERLGGLTRDFQARAMQQLRQDPEYFMKSLRLQGWFVDNLECELNTSRERVAGLCEAVLAEHPSESEGLFPDPELEPEPAAGYGGSHDAWSEPGYY